MSSVDAARRAGILDRWERANAMVGALCQPRGTAGAREWRLSIPARPEHDPDLIISSALADVPDLLAALDQAEAEIAQLLAALTALRGHLTVVCNESGWRTKYSIVRDLVDTALVEAAPAGEA